LKNNDPIEFKLAGGAAAQTLGLLNALYIKKKISREFRIRYFPHSTGTYWPFAIDFLLSDQEVSSKSAQIRGLMDDQTFTVGKIIRDHPLESRFFSYERLLKWLRGLRLEFVLRRLTGEIALEARPLRLELITKRTRRVSGGFVPMLNAEVLKELDLRFRAGRDEKSPFSRNTDTKESYIAIHYRIGDKRAKFTHDKDFGGDGIFSPRCFERILSQLDLPKLKIYVVSDEPTVAQSLLQEVGIEANLLKISMISGLTCFDYHKRVCLSEVGRKFRSWLLYVSQIMEEHHSCPQQPKSVLRSFGTSPTQSSLRQISWMKVTPSITPNLN